MNKTQEARLKKLVAITGVTHALLFGNYVSFRKNDKIIFMLKSSAQESGKAVIEHTVEEFFNGKTDDLSHCYQMSSINPLFYLFWEAPKYLSKQDEIWKDNGLILTYFEGELTSITDATYYLKDKNKMFIIDATEERVVEVYYSPEEDSSKPNLIMKEEDKIFKAHAEPYYPYAVRTTLEEAITNNQMGADGVYKDFLVMMLNAKGKIEMKDRKLYLPEDTRSCLSAVGSEELLRHLNELDLSSKVYWTYNSISTESGMTIVGNETTALIKYKGLVIEVSRYA